MTRVGKVNANLYRLPFYCLCAKFTPKGVIRSVYKSIIVDILKLTKAEQKAHSLRYFGFIFKKILPIDKDEISLLQFFGHYP